MRHPETMIYISPGGNGDPHSPKMSLLSEVAKSKGLHVKVPDCTQIQNPEIRVQRLLESRASGYRHLILAGSSMGGYVSAVAAETLDVLGLFLIGPALYLQPYENLDPQPRAKIISVVHGLQDEIVSAESVHRFAKNFDAKIHVIEGNHSLEEQLPKIRILFAQFLDTCLEEIEEAESVRSANAAKLRG